jgi:hypothetical protein
MRVHWIVTYSWIQLSALVIVVVFNGPNYSFRRFLDLSVTYGGERSDIRRIISLNTLCVMRWQ